MLANKMGKGMIMGAPKPKVEEEKIEHNAPVDKETGTYENVIKATAVVKKKKKPKRTSAFGVGEERIPISKPPPNIDKKEDIPENKEDIQETKENKNKDIPSDIKQSAFTLFDKNDDKKEEPKSNNLFDKIEEEKKPLEENNNKPNLDFLNNLEEKEVKNSTLFFDENNKEQNNDIKKPFGENEGENSGNKNISNDNTKKDDGNKKRLAFLYDDDD